MSSGDDASAGRRRVCLLTGAGGTLGDAFCRAYAAEYDIVAVCRRRAPNVPSQDESFVDPLAPGADLPENRHRVHVIRADLERPGEIERVADIALARYGRVDLLVNNAAYSRWHPAGLTDTADAARTTADFQRHFMMNVAVPHQLAAAIATRFWMPRDRTNRTHRRNIVNVSSISASRVYPGGQGVYAASKAALNQLTRHLAAEFGVFGVRANAIAPDSFPARVSTRRVADAIVALDRSDESGRILVLEGPAAS